MLVDGKVTHGMPQEGLFIGDRGVLTIEMEADMASWMRSSASSCRSPLSPQETSAGHQNAQDAMPWFMFPAFKRYERLPVAQKRGSQ